MGKKPDQIENEIRQHRAEISRRMDALQDRVQDRMGAARDEARNRVSGAVGEARGVLNPGEMMQEHPVSAMAGALGLGVLLGVASEGLTSGGGSSRESRRAQRSNGGAASGGLSSLLSYLAGPAAATAQDELQQLVREAIDAFKGQASSVMSESRRAQRRFEEAPDELPIE